MLVGLLLDPFALFDDGWRTQDVQLDLLPENLAAIFRVENGLLLSSEDLSRPQIGDLRISWQVLPAGPVHGYAVLDDGGLSMGEGAGLLRGAAIDADLPGLEQGSRAGRSEARRVGNECVRTCRSRWAPYN